MAQKALVSGSEDPHVYFRLQVVLDADLAALLNTDPFERATLLERVSTQFHQRAWKYYFFDPAVSEDANLIGRVLIIFPQSLETFVQHHAL